jgi:hypothetical protein
VTFFTPAATRLATLRSFVRRISAAGATLIPNHTVSNTASRCGAGKLSIPGSISGAIRTRNGISAGKFAFPPRPNQFHHRLRAGLPPNFPQTTCVTAKSQPASTVFRRNHLARRASTRKTARVASTACAESPKRRHAEAMIKGK